MKKGPIRIEPFRHPIAQDPHYAGPAPQGLALLSEVYSLGQDGNMSYAVTAEKTWRVLEDAIREIHNQNASGLSFEELYR
jgi:cullin 3